MMPINWDLVDPIFTQNKKTYNNPTPQWIFLWDNINSDWNKTSHWQYIYYKTQKFHCQNERNTFCCISSLNRQCKHKSFYHVLWVNKPLSALYQHVHIDALLLFPSPSAEHMHSALGISVISHEMAELVQCNSK